MDPREQRIKEIISKIIKVPMDKLGSNDDLVEQYGMDSMSRIEIVTELEKTFDILIEDSEAIKLRSVAKCLELVTREAQKK